jgi:hypothetical protein
MYQSAYQARAEFEDGIKTYSGSSAAPGFSSAKPYRIQRSDYTLESIVKSAQDYVIDFDRKPELIRAGREDMYSGDSNKYDKKHSGNDYQQIRHSNYLFSPDVFLSDDRAPSAFVSNFEEIREFSEQAFENIMEKKLPNDIVFNVCSWQELIREYPEFSEQGRPDVLGFAINRRHLSLSSIIFARKDNLDRLLLTIGHEIGHVISRQLSIGVDEEAKAFAFSIAWADAIRKNDIAGLKKSIKGTIAPAENGLHDRALMFVLDKIRKGMSAIEVFYMVSSGKISAELSL